MATASTSSNHTSIFRSKSNRSSSNNEAVLVTGPHISDDINGDNTMAIVEKETYQDVDISVSSSSGNTFRRFVESSFGILGKTPKEQEMDEIKTSNQPSERLVQINSPVLKKEVVDTFDICREYNYSGDDEDEAELNKLYFNDTGTHLSPSNAAILSKMSNVATYVLGKTYHPIHDYNLRRIDESSLFWFTYRCDFPCIEPYGITSDAGWGCMLRALQMMCGQALRLHYKCRDWRPPNGQQQRRLDPFLRSILTWFADFSSCKESIYSLHNMVATGHAKYDKLPGEWYGPGTACYVLRDLVAIHERNQTTCSNNEKQKPIFRVLVAAGGTVYRDVVQETMVRENKKKLESEKKKVTQMLPPPAHPLDVAWEEELLDPLSEALVNLHSYDIAWDTSLLLLIPLRLGLRSFNGDYVEAVSHTFSLPQSIGVLGGRPRGARWFYGALSDGSKIFGLDPHTVQAAPKRRTALLNGKQSSVVELSDEYLRSVHTTHPEVFSLSKMDPSIALGFYCRDRNDLESVFASLQTWKASHPKSPDLFTVADRMPNYTMDPSTSLEISTDNSQNNTLDSDDEDGDAVDDDEFVML
jgi:cysteine protease ATG4